MWGYSFFNWSACLLVSVTAAEDSRADKGMSVHKSSVMNLINYKSLVFLGRTTASSRREETPQPQLANDISGI